MDEMIGRRFGRWVVVSKSDIKKHNAAWYNCRCDCGTEKVVIASSLRIGRSKSCGCGRVRLKGEKNGHWKGGRYINHAGYVMVYMPEHHRVGSNGYVREHIVLAEKALGKPLPDKAQIHHLGDPRDNSKIIICENQEYHFLIHVREEAKKACGHPDWRRCKFCQKYDDVKNLHITKCRGSKGGWNVHHQACESEYNKPRTIKRATERAAKRATA